MPPALHEDVLKEDSALGKLISFTRARQDVWPSRAAAREWFAAQEPWSRWDARVLDLYVVRALLSVRVEVCVIRARLTM